MDDNSKLLKTIERVALEAGELLLARMGQVEIHEKQARDLVTAADLESQELIRSRLEDAFPGFGFLGEEQSHETDWKQGKCWIVDPIDGTMNFAHQMPGFSVSVGLFSEGQPVAGVVYDPVLREVFSCAINQGAWLNGRQVHTSRCTELRRALLVCSFPSTVTPETEELIRFNRVVQHATLRRLGSAALNLCYVGCGRMDGYWASTLNLWDIAAGMLFASEAGACVTHLAGSAVDFADPQFLAASTAELHGELLPILQLN